MRPTSPSSARRHGLAPFLILLGLFGTAAANPVPTPPPVSDGPPAAAGDAAQAKDCTTWVTSLEYGFTGDFRPTINVTVYTATSFVYTHVPCGGCALATTHARAPVWGGIGPVVQVAGTVTAATATSVMSTVCLAENGDKPRMAVPKERRQTPTTYTPPQSPSSMPTPPPSTPLVPSPTARGADCTATRLSAAGMTLGPVKTVWTATATGTSHVDCGGCRFVTVAPFSGMNHPGPVASFNSTVTATVPSAAVVYACLKSPSVVATPDPWSPPPSNTLPIERTKRAVETGRVGL